jgi:hypothetical protein
MYNEIVIWSQLEAGALICPYSRWNPLACLNPHLLYMFDLPAQRMLPVHESVNLSTRLSGRRH